MPFRTNFGRKKHLRFYSVVSGCGFAPPFFFNHKNVDNSLVFPQKINILWKYCGKLKNIYTNLRFSVKIDLMKNDFRKELAVCGFEAVKAISKFNPQKIRRFYYTRDRMMDFKDLFKSLAERKVPYNNISEGELEKLSGTPHHQGVVAMIDLPEIPHLNTKIADDWLHKKESAILLDRVGNANNLGAIIRSAAYFGFRNIVIPRDEEQTSVTTSSYRVAQGGMEFINIYSIQSIEKLLSSMQGKMIRFGTDVRANHSVEKIPDLCNENKKPALIVLGNEEHGISKIVRQNCDELVKIPFSVADSAQTSQIESLNVAQAAAIVLYECRKIHVQ